MNRLSQFVSDDRGVDLIEYALLAGLISVAAIGALTEIRTSIVAIYDNLNSSMGTAAAAVTPTAP